MGPQSHTEHTNRPRARRPLLVLLLLLAGCAIPGRSLGELANEINATLRPDPLIVDVGDVIAVKFPNHESWNQRARIKSDGFANFRFIGELELRGLTETEMVERIRGAYEATVEDNELTVEVAEWATRNAYLVGETAGRGTIPITGRRLALVEAIGRGGGHSWRTARMRRIHFIRWLPEEKRYQRWKIDARPSHWDEAPIYLQPYDIVYIPPTVITVINNWVDVYIRRNIPLPILIRRAEASI